MVQNNGRVWNVRDSRRFKLDKMHNKVQKAKKDSK